MRWASRRPQRRSCSEREALARAAVWALAEAGVEVTVWNRTPERAAELAADLGVTASERPGPAELLVNATSVGLRPARLARRAAARRREGGGRPRLRSRSDALRALGRGARRAPRRRARGARAPGGSEPRDLDRGGASRGLHAPSRRPVRRLVHTPRSKQEADACRYARQWRSPAPSSSPSSGSRSSERRSSRLQTLVTRPPMTRRPVAQQTADPAATPGSGDARADGARRSSGAAEGRPHP